MYTVLMHKHQTTYKCVWAEKSNTGGLRYQLSLFL